MLGHDPLRQPCVGIVIVNWNGRDHTLHCLQQVESLVYVNLHVVVVDNASTDGSENAFRSAFPGVDVIQAGGNLGYGGGNNLGVQTALSAGAELIWILNPDVEFGPEVLGTLVCFMDACPWIGLLSPRVVHPDHGRDEALNHFQPYASVPDPYFRAPSPDGPLNLIECAPGCSLLIRRGTWEALGGFDLRYFHFWEDVDLCWRAWSAGWPVAMALDVRVAHRAGSTTRGASSLSMYYMLRNLLMFAAKAGKTSVRRAMLRPPIARQWLACVFGVRTFSHPAVKAAILRAVDDAIQGRVGRCSHYSPS